MAKKRCLAEDQHSLSSGPPATGRRTTEGCRRRVAVAGDPRTVECGSCPLSS